MLPENEPQESSPTERSGSPAAPSAEGLIEEMERLRRRLMELQEQLDGQATDTRRGQPREPLSVELRFLTDFDIDSAEGVDLSASGIGLRLDEPIPFVLRFATDGELVLRHAELVHAAARPEGGQRLGFRFTNRDPVPDSF